LLYLGYYLRRKTILLSFATSTLIQPVGQRSLLAMASASVNYSATSSSTPISQRPKLNGHRSLTDPIYTKILLLGLRRHDLVSSTNHPTSYAGVLTEPVKHLSSKFYLTIYLQNKRFISKQRCASSNII
jgi:hypothetical protein